MKTVHTWLAGVALALLAADAGAWPPESDALLRCDGWIIQQGQSQYEVRGKCGDPQGAESRTEWRAQPVYPAYCLPGTICAPVVGSIVVPVAVEIWYYEDVGGVPKALHFENGRLAWIEALWNLRRR